VSEPTGSQFWWTWTAEAATAIGTIGAVIVALFGGWLRAHLAASRLEIRLGRGDKKGFRVPVLMSLDGKQIDTVGRWYHLCVENKRRWSPAKDVRLLLLKLEFPDGTIVLLTRLCQGQQATVLQLPSAPRTAEEAEEQKRVAVVA